jgi:hypothetical protein
VGDRPEWFAPKRFGFGSGLPIAWQGWALLGWLLAMIGLAAWIFGRDDWRVLTIVVPALIVYVVVAAFTTKGGWRWHWGWHIDDDD